MAGDHMGYRSGAAQSGILRSTLKPTGESVAGAGEFYSLRAGIGVIGDGESCRAIARRLRGKSHVNRASAPTRQTANAIVGLGKILWIGTGKSEALDRQRGLFVIGYGHRAG